MALRVRRIYAKSKHNFPAVSSEPIGERGGRVYKRLLPYLFWQSLILSIADKNKFSLDSETTMKQNAI